MGILDYDIMRYILCIIDQWTCNFEQNLQPKIQINSTIIVNIISWTAAMLDYDYVWLIYNQSLINQLLIGKD